MKKLSISLIALAALALGACTSDDIALNDKASNIEIGGDGYVSVAINLPTTPSTRAANDVYDDGLESEYAVNDATLLLFAGESEATAVYYTQYDLTTAWDLYETTTDNITSRSQITQKIDTPASGDIYALVVLNASSMLTGGTSPTLGGVSLTNATISDLQSTTATSPITLDAMMPSVSGATGTSTTYFYMANAPLISTPGNTKDPSSGTVTTLTKIDETKIYSTEAEAAANPAAEIYVERGMAKVTVTDATSTSAEGEIEATITGFTLDLTNNVSYPIRNTTGSENWWGYANGYTSLATNYRMAGNVEVGTDLYRTYWATDPNYDTYPYITTVADNPDYTSKEGARDYGTIMNSLAGGTFEDTELGDENPQYCLENTFNVAHQNQDETTRVIVKAKLNEGKAFFTWDGIKSTLYTTTTEGEPTVTTTGLDKIKALILSTLEADGYLEAAEAVWVGPSDEEKEEDPTLSSNMYDYITIVFVDEEGKEIEDDDLTASDDLSFTYTVSEDVVASWFVDPDDRSQKATAIPDVLNPKAEPAEGETLNAYAAVVAELNDHHDVAYYEDGVSYYPVMIKHFGDDLTYWDITEVQGVSYPTTLWGKSAEANWLGRYGVLRNNWYDVRVTAVNSVGSATVPTAYGDPDDPVDKWISIEINILSWAKRTQDASL